METESISEVLYFGTRRPFYHERLRRRSTKFGHGHYRRVEKNFSIFEYVKFSDCEVNVFVNGLK